MDTGKHADPTHQGLAPIVEISITADDAQWLAEFTRRLVQDRLAACGNLVPVVRSIYRWQDEIQDSQEALVLLHTRSALVSAVIERTTAEHPYDQPQVVVRPIAQSSPGYHRWVLEATANDRNPQTEPAQ